MRKVGVKKRFFTFFFFSFITFILRCSETFIVHFLKIDRCWWLTPISVGGISRSTLSETLGPTSSISLSSALLLVEMQRVHVSDATSHTLLSTGNWTSHNKPHCTTEESGPSVKYHSLTLLALKNRLQAQSMTF